MPAQVSGLSRYPIKGLSYEPLNSATLQAGRGVSGDRAFALALPATVFDERNPQPLSKFEFMVLARQEALARLNTSYDGSTGLLSAIDGTERLSANVHCAEGRAAIAAFFARFLPEDQKSSKPRLVTAANHCFTDVGVHSSELMHAISVLNLASVRDLEARIGERLDPRRFRANVLVEGLDPWVENEWLNHELMLGAVRCRGMRLTRRCPATEVNPDSATRDINVPRELMRFFGHIHLGIYLTVIKGGVLRIGDTVAAAG
ncbi:MOSC domain-containing protein [Bradyrhizobium sp. RT3a]|uniref:MOSC domain-containing protein n=1 Tax=unclassified Bradyrhizobium TaxID=2631580 RepID=UPI003397CCA4